MVKRKTELKKEGEVNVNNSRAGMIISCLEKFIIFYKWSISEGQKYIGERIENHLSKSFAHFECVCYISSSMPQNCLAKIQMQ